MLDRKTFLLALTLLFPVAAPAQSSPALHQVHKIHVASFGSTAETTRFRSLLEEALRANDFEVVAASADATLTGTFSSEAHGDYSSARATLQLKSHDGKQILWSGDYSSQHRGNIPEDVVKTLAQTCAERLHHDWQKN